MVKDVSIYDELGEERKQLQEDGKLPAWVTTVAWQMLKENYLSDKYPDLKSVYVRVASHAARYTSNQVLWENKFFDLLWNGYLAASTPVLSNMGTGIGCPVSCSGGVVGDSVYSFYDAQKEAAVLSKNGFGTSGYLGNIRPRGSRIAGIKGAASGVLPVFKDFVQMSRDISQGSQRRGAWAGYIEIDHDDFYELVNYISKNPDDANIGWNVSNKFIERLDAGDKDAIERYQKALKLKMISGKGYFEFIDKVNDQNPQMYKDRNLTVKASNLCSEIQLFSDEDHTFSCVLSSMNASLYDEWKDTDAVFDATVFLDCVNQDLIEIGKKTQGMEKVVRFATKSRALGLGMLGFHTYLQENMIPFESMDAYYKNIEIFQHLNNETIRASQWMSKEWGEPLWCKGYGLRNTHRIAIAPNLSSALICGSVSQGIEPIYKNAYVQNTAAGKMDRVNPTLLKLMKEKDIYNDETVKNIINNNGSVQHVDWLDDHEKSVFKTAFEIDQKQIIRLASARQRYIDQAQSINLFFSADEDESYISEVHKLAFKDPYIKSLYYIRSESGVNVSKGECIACHG
ncbi:NrdA Ribonucleotide reductase, alpha subunit [uncultured Caudovirales phage]|uniref:Ribonucleoside-diphosphate reductase n=1 Tax=uncultured Caudovirales phage TaxID=2100421 RepID=A0A6J5T4L0_9CAUD|nr:NrdA Ribonucleotide reductase, alpha subunit [uncultured Caudovirales phage]